MTRGGHLMCGGPRLDRSRGGPTWRRLDARRQRFSAFTLRVRGQRTLLCRHVPCSTSPAVRPLQHVPCSTSPTARPLQHVPCSTSTTVRPPTARPLEAPSVNNRGACTHLALPARPDPPAQPPELAGPRSPPVRVDRVTAAPLHVRQWSGPVTRSAGTSNDTKLEKLTTRSRHNGPCPCMCGSGPARGSLPLP
jgi:hypothetical protein